MPSPHPRVGVVLDDPMSEALSAFRQSLGEDLPQAGLARRAIFEGIALEAIVQEARTRDAADRFLSDLRERLDRAGLPPAVHAEIVRRLDRVDAESARRDRRRRQMELLSEPDPSGLTALHVTDTIDALDDQPA